jgi:aryl-alcohol dehydrogenase-like predicted oxidoreductase
LKLALGTVQFGIDYGINSSHNKVKINEVDDILNFALDSNIRLLDTAPAYGDSESIVGSASTSDFNIVTKTRNFHKRSIEKEDVDALVTDLNQSLQFLNRKNIYGLLVHNADDLLKPGADKIFRKLITLKQEGFVSKIGVSVYTENQIQKIIERFDIDIIQLPFNILDCRLLTTGTLGKVCKKGIEVHARSVFLQGLLLMKKNSIPKKFNRWSNTWLLWNEWLKDNKITALDATLRYVISNPTIDKVLVGVNSKKQLQEIVTSSLGFLPNIPSELFTVDEDLLNPSNWNNL